MARDNYRALFVIYGDRRFRRISLILLSLLIAAAAIFVLAPQAKAGLHTSLFVLQILDSPLKPQSWITKEPLRDQVTYPTPRGEGVADVYRIPGDGRRAAVLLFLGANAAGRDDTDVIKLGDALARAGFVVMLHWSSTMGLQSNIDPNEIESLVWAFQYLRSREFVDQGRAGMGGFSVGGSLAIVAAADPRIRNHVVFINSLGAYYDAQDLFLQIASGNSFYEGHQEPWEVDQLTRLVFANEMIESLERPAERELLEFRFLRNGGVAESTLVDLSDHAQIVWRLLERPTLEEAGALFQNLPTEFRQQVAGISPSSHVADLQARVMVMHDEGDLLIPVGETRRLAAALQGRGDFRYTETRIFDHVRPGGGGDFWLLVTEAAKLYWHMYDIIRVAT